MAVNGMQTKLPARPYDTLPATPRDSTDSAQADELEDAEALLQREEALDGQNARPKRPRAGSSTFSGFQIKEMLHIPYSQDSELHDSSADKIITVWSGSALVIGTIIGSGIFASPGVIMADTFAFIL